MTTLKHITNLFKLFSLTSEEILEHETQNHLWLDYYFLLYSIFH